MDQDFGFLTFYTIHNLDSLPFFGTPFPHLKNEEFDLYNLQSPFQL